MSVPNTKLLFKELRSLAASWKARYAPDSYAGSFVSVLDRVVYDARDEAFIGAAEDLLDLLEEYER